jgi:serine/threonine protein kinase
MPPPPKTHPSAEQLKAYALGKLPAAELEALAQHLESCPQCLELAAARHADSFVGKLRAAHPPAATAGWAPQELVPERAPDKQELADLPAELRDSTKYRVLRELGRGGMGVIYLAEHQMMGKRVALKVIGKALLDHSDAEARFRTEVRAAAKLDHPNIVKALDADRLGEMHLLVMDYVDGLSLAEVLQRKGPFPVLHACNYIRQAALGLQHAFEQGMVHRDIKPQNLMLTRDGKVKILDFGLARLAREQKGKPGVTRVGDFMGTPEYVAPEQAMDASTADIRADLYSLGCTLYFLLAGRPPFQEGSAVQTIMAHLEKDVPPLTTLRADVPAKLWSVVARLLAKDPAQRYQKPVELAQALVPFCKPGSKQPAAAPKPTQLPVSSSQASTRVGGDTSQLPGRRSPVAPVVVPPQAVAAVAPRDESPLETPARKSAPGNFANRRNLALVAGIGVVVLLALGGWLLSGVILRVRTSEGVVLLQLDQPGAEVFVDGAKVQVTWGADGKKADIRVKPGTRELSVIKDGFKTFGEKVTLEEGGRHVLTVRLEPTPLPADISKAGSASRAPEGLPPAKIGDKEKTAGGKADLAPKKTTTALPTMTPAADAFVPLFNGKDLTGWMLPPGDKSTWKVENGVLIGSGEPGYLCTERSDYTDLDLRLEASISHGENGGVFIRTTKATPRDGYEVDINCPSRDLSKGNLAMKQTGSILVYAEKRFAGRITNLVSHRADEWFRLDISVKANRLTVKVNDQAVADYVDENKYLLRGSLALQHFVAGKQIKFRKIEIRVPVDKGSSASEPVGINEALERGINYLRAHSWQETPKYKVGYSALAGLTLLECGVPAGDPLIQGAATLIRSQAASLGFTYELSLALLFLDRLGEPKDQALIQGLGLRLLAGQVKDGGWSYFCPLLPNKDQAQPPGQGDNSNTQFALLGLWTARRHDVPVESALLLAAKRFQLSQVPDGHWNYQASPGASASPAMTAAGLLGLAMGHGAAFLKRKGGYKERAVKNDPAITKGLGFLAENIGTLPPGGRLTDTPMPGLYFLWALERIATLYDLKTIGGKDWYGWGSQLLLVHQRADGAWANGQYHGSSPHLDTCFALLFLKRANLLQDLTDILRVVMPTPDPGPGAILSK